MRAIYFIILLFLISCNGDECGNKSSVFGKYVNHSHKNDTNSITLNKDGTYYYYYKKSGEQEKTFTGKWKQSSTKNECQVIFVEWKDIVGYLKVDELSTNYAHHRGDKLMFFEDIEGAEYEKVD